MTYASDRLDVETEQIVLNNFNYFSVPAKRRKKLQSTFNFIDLEWSKLINHMLNRWLSVIPAFKRLLQNWAALKSYFKSMYDSPKFFSDLFRGENPNHNMELLVLLNF